MNAEEGATFGPCTGVSNSTRDGLGHHDDGRAGDGEDTALDRQSWRP